MKKSIINKIIVLLFGAIFILPGISFAETKKDELAEKFPAFTAKSCQNKYKTEVSTIFKLVDTVKAKKKVSELQSLRKDQDENIKNIFTKIERKAETEDKKLLIEDKRDEVLKIIDDRRVKIDELQNSIQISNKDVELLVRETLLEQSTSTPKLCPINSDTIKDIRATNKIKLKKLVEDKKDLYLTQTKEIQEEFLTDIKTSLTDLTEDLKK